ncbi:hypothetical protein TBC1_12589 [Lentimicrobium saccharophilum]|uniref:Translocation and assembly module TamB C-terminal domain-containing protein n=1 Tax=Lentimicrobium saccharophilum TaxID=1678841 RepID=A0A0S7BV83_9BACT|nr:translocation/assembly module TamB domain-containing protein [Lentimicrobium saccharophilum]GAP44778.1 hypothetical protein TBC1_12589 [Lentimicrobium saccharophilum]
MSLTFIYGLFRTSYVQTRLVQVAANYLSAELGTKISIGAIDISWFFNVVLEDVLIKDRHNQNLLKAARIKVRPGKIDHKRRFLAISAISLDKAEINIARYASDSLMNYSFITDYFSSSDTAARETTARPWKLGISGIRISGSQFTYNNGLKDTVTSGIDYNHISLSGLNLEIRRLAIFPDSITAQIRSLSLKEKSGFILNDFFTNCLISKDSIVARQLHIKTPGSEINVDLKFLHSGFGSYNYFIDSVKMHGLFDRSTIQLGDIGYFTPALAGVNESLKIHGLVMGTVSSLKARQFRFGYRENTYFEGNITMDGLPDISETFIHLNVRDFKTNYQDLKAFRLPGGASAGIPEIVNNLGNIRIKGYFTGFINDFVSAATFRTGTGTVKTDLSLKSGNDQHIQYNGHLTLSEWQLGKSVKAEKYLGLVDLSAEIDGMFSRQKEISATLAGDVQRIQILGNEFNDIRLNGQFLNREFNGQLTLRDELIDLDFNGLVDLSDSIPRFNFISEVKDAYLSRLNLWERDSSASLSTTMSLNFTGSNIDNLLGNLNFYNTLYKEAGNYYPVNKIELKTFAYGPGLKTLSLDSDFASADFSGKFTFSDFYSSLLNIVNTYLPSFRPYPKMDRIVSHEQLFDYYVVVKDVSHLTELFLPNLKLHSTAYLFGSYNSTSRTILLNGQTDLFEYNGIKFHNWTIRGQNTGNSLELTTGMSSIVFKEQDEENDQALGIDNFSFNAAMRGDSITYNFNWGNKNRDILNRGDISGYFTFNDQPVIRSGITRADFIINDSTFTARQDGDIIIDSTSIYINNLKIKGLNQELTVAGKVSENSSDLLSVKFERFDISNADLLLNIDNVDFDGILSGSLSANDLYKTRKLQADMTVKNFAFNKEILGDARVKTRWDNDRSGLDIDVGIIYKGNISTHTPVSIKGFIYTDEEAPQNFDLDITTLNYNLATLNPFLKGFASNLKGYASGDLKMEGTYNQPAFSGNLQLMRTQMKIDYLNVTYSLADKVEVTPELISATNVMVYDSLGNTGLLNFSLSHNYFRDMVMDMTVMANNLAGLNTTSKDNELFYGSAFATGNVSIRGPFDDLRMNIRVKSDKETNIYIPINLNVDATENAYIRFVDNEDEHLKPALFEPVTSGVNLDMFLNVTKDANIQLFLPDNIGNIKANGNGQLQMGIDTRGDITMFGDYIIESGTFLFTLQNILNRVFSIDQGSKISFNGSPYEADLNVKAVYKLRASLKGIPELASIPEYANRSIPVDCIIHLKNNLYNPDIGFSIRLPDAEESLRQSVFAAIDTTNEVGMTQQMVSLLLLKSFSFTGNAGLAGSVGSSSIEILTNQLSNMLSQISKDVDIGVNYRTGDALSSEALEVALSTHLFDDRVTIDGNLGVMTSGTTQNTNNIIGDVVIDVKITRDGRFRVKAYNKSNNPFEITSYNANYKQGVGIYYRYEFDRFSELFRRQRKKQPKTGNDSKS